MVEAVSFACSDIGYACEWGLLASSAAEVQMRFRDHARCAHGISPVSPELEGRVTAAMQRL
jgi:predicted small metal-binding protein